MMEPFRRRLSADVHDWVSLSWAVNDSDLISMLGKIGATGRRKPLVHLLPLLLPCA